MNPYNHMAKLLIVLGILLLIAGLLMLLLPRIPLIGRLPGDIVIKKDNFTFYFPLATSIIISIILTIIFSIFKK